MVYVTDSQDVWTIHQYMYIFMDIFYSFKDFSNCFEANIRNSEICISSNDKLNNSVNVHV